MDEVNPRGVTFPRNSGIRVHAPAEELVGPSQCPLLAVSHEGLGGLMQGNAHCWPNSVDLQPGILVSGATQCSMCCIYLYY